MIYTDEELRKIIFKDYEDDSCSFYCDVSDNPRRSVYYNKKLLTKEIDADSLKGCSIITKPSNNAFDNYWCISNAIDAAKEGGCITFIEGDNRVVYKKVSDYWELINN